MHDLWRTFITFAESQDVSDVERLRKPMEAIGAYLYEKCGMTLAQR